MKEHMTNKKNPISSSPKEKQNNEDISNMTCSLENHNSQGPYPSGEQ